MDISVVGNYIVTAHHDSENNAYTLCTDDNVEKPNKKTIIRN